jgi:hypothetical protein
MVIRPSQRPHRASPVLSFQKKPVIALKHRLVATLIWISLALQPAVHVVNGAPLTPLSHFAPAKMAAPNPFVWKSPGPSVPFLESSVGKNIHWPEFQPKQAQPVTPTLLRLNPVLSTGPWQPADPAGPLLPPDGLPVVPENGFAGPLPGIPNAFGNCVISGEVSDATSLNPVAGAFIDIIGTDRTVETDAKGRFTIGGLSAGTFTLEATKLGYSTETSVVTTLEGQPAEVRIGLRAKPADDTTGETMLEEETIVGEYQGESQGDFNLTLSAEAPSLTSGINREDFARTGVGDAGEAIAKVSGANIVDGKYAVVRGLADRYVTTTFNGGQIASADPSRKAIQLDLFPTNVIESINVAKTYSPELPADFGGAAIDIVSRAFPEERILQAKFKYETNSALDDAMYVLPGRSLGFFGDSGAPLPDILETTDANGNPLFRDNSNTPHADLKNRYDEFHLSRDLLPEKAEAEPKTSYELTYGETFELNNGMRLGFMSAFAQSSGDSNNSSDIHNQNRDYIRDDWERGVETSGFISAALELNEFNLIQFNWFDKHDVKDVVTRGSRVEGTSQEFGRLVDPANTPIVRDTFGADAVYFREFWDIGTVERDLRILQLLGSNRFSEHGIRFDWSVTDSESTESRPHTSHFEYGVLDFSRAALQPYVDRANIILDATAKAFAPFIGLDPASATWAEARGPILAITGPETVQAIEDNAGLPIIDESLGEQRTLYPYPALTGNNAQTLSAFRRRDLTKETATDSRFAMTFPYHFGEPEDRRLFEFSLGGSNLKKTRDVSARSFGLVTTEANGNFSIPATLDGAGLALDPGGLAGYFTGNTNTGPYYRYGVGDAGVENINTKLDQQGIFINGKLQLEDFYMAGGVRREREDYQIDVASIPLVPFTDAQIDALGWEERESQEALLPSFIIGNTFFEKSLDALFAWSRTVARPTFWEFLPTTSTDQSSGIVRRGNVRLQRTEIENFDLALTLRPKEWMTVRTSLFHKKLDRPLVQVFRGDGITYSDGDQFNNKPYTADISGMEFEAEVVTPQGISLKGNITHIDAILNYFDTQQQAVKSQLPYQPSLIANATLSYEYEPWNIVASLVYNYNGAYPVILKENPEQSEVTREAIQTFDFFLSKTWEGEWADTTVRLGVKNLFNAEDRYVFEDRTYGNDVIGRTYLFEISARF